MKEEMEVLRYDTRPAPFNTLLWTANIEVKGGFYTGYYSLLDADKEIKYFYFPKQHELLTPYRHHEDVNKLIDLTNNWYTLEMCDKGVAFNDLRFGQRTGWLIQEGEFVFSYIISLDDGEVQIEEAKKEFSDGKAIALALWNRMLGQNK